MYRSIAVSGYRSLRDVAIPLGRVTVVTGDNGSGKSNLYRALRLLASCGQDRVIATLAAEGGLGSVLWAGPESLQAARRTGAVEGTTRKGPISLRIGIGGDALSYLVDLGLPVPDERSAFNRDPEIKREAVWVGPVMRPSTVFARRKRAAAEVREDDRWTPLPHQLPPHASLLGENALPELRTLRDELGAWRFYDALRVDPTAPARRPQVGTRTWALADDGADLAAALQTIREHGARPVAEAVDDAFPGSRLGIRNDDGLFDVELTQPGMLRPLRSAELSDGTLRYLMLLAALMAPDMPGIVALNEPENSLHPSLLPALGRLVSQAGRHTQVFLVTHSAPLVRAIADSMPEGLEHIELGKDLGETVVAGQGLLTRPRWEWGSR